jgi:hypothetical protein
MSRRSSARRGPADQAAADASSAAMRAEMSRTLHRLVADTRANADPVFTAQAVAQLVDAWAESALTMIAAASSFQPKTGVADASLRVAATSCVPPDEVHGAMLAALAIIVDAARAGRPDVDTACLRFADTFSSCLRDAIAGAYLRTAAAFEDQLGLTPGIAN